MKESCQVFYIKRKAIADAYNLLKEWILRLTNPIRTQVFCYLYHEDFMSLLTTNGIRVSTDNQYVSYLDLKKLTNVIG